MRVFKYKARGEEPYISLIYHVQKLYRVLLAQGYPAWEAEERIITEKLGQPPLKERVGERRYDFMRDQIFAEHNRRGAWPDDFDGESFGAKERPPWPNVYDSIGD